MAIEAVVVAFRTSLFSLILKNDIVGNQEQTSGSWSVVVAGEESDFQQKIQDFADSEVSLSIIIYSLQLLIPSATPPNMEAIHQCSHA